ncbi:MAG: hypothetical protein AAF596_08590 [Planctomycetota bacterium]
MTIDRRRATTDRRDAEAPTAKAGDGAAVDAADGAAKPLTPRKKVSRRRQIDPTTCERDYTDQEVEFMNALDDYKRSSGRMFPTCSEVLEVIRSLGYVQLSPAEIAAREPVAADAPEVSADETGDADGFSADGLADDGSEDFADESEPAFA